LARRKTKKTQSRKKRRKSTKTKGKTTFLSGISPQRRIDIIGIILILIGVLTLVSLFTQSVGSVTGWWVTNLSIAVGWNVYILPVALVGLGAWMLLRNMDRFPHLSIERVIGIILLFINLATWFHLFIDGNFDDARMGVGGGFVGGAFKIFLVQALGKPGAIIALIAWLMISLILTINLTMANVLKWLGTGTKNSYQKVSQFTQKQITKIKDKNKISETELPQNQGKAESRSQDSAAPQQKDGGTSESVVYADTPDQPVWVLPDPDQILDPSIKPPDNEENDQHRARVIEETLRSFGAPAKVVKIRHGPTITLFGVEPSFIETRNGRTRVRVSKIVALADDLALALAAARIRIQAPVPGKGYIGIEVPNQQVALVSLSEVISSPIYQDMPSPLKMVLGKDVAGNTVAADLSSMPHLLIAGTTGAGKSVCINDILVSFLLRMTPYDLRMVLVDPKRVELTGYNGIPHLLSPVIVDAEHVVGSLKWMLREMDSRYRKFSDTGTRNIANYNKHCENNGKNKIPYILIVIDELADLMLLAPDETERAITRLAQLARATGIHLIIATQRPSTDILTGLIKANFPARIAFAVASSVDSRVILDQPGAERLLGRGDMLFQAPDAAAPVRIQSAFVSDREINHLSAYWREFTISKSAPDRPDMSAAFERKQDIIVKQTPLWEEIEEEEDLDSRFAEAVQIAKDESQASISMLQRKMRIGYTRAARIIDKMQEKGLISEPDPQSQIRYFLGGDS